LIASRKIITLASSTLRIDLSEVIHIGGDVHEPSYHVAVLSDRRLIATWTQPASPELLIEPLKPIRSQVAQVV
jgi:hypothetical protein